MDNQVGLLCKAGGLLQAIRQTFHRRSAMMGETISHMIEQVQLALSAQFARLKHDIQSGQRQDDTRLDALAALNFAISNVVVGPASKDRRILLRLAMHVFLRTDIGKKEELAFISDNLSTLEVVCNISEYINSACDGSTLFWIRSMVPAYFSSVFRRPEQAHRLQYVLASLSDALKTLKGAVHVDGAALCEKFADEIEQMVKETIMQPLARDIDVELRFHAHAHLGVQKALVNLCFCSSCF
jgi:WASH complex subunit 7